ncbi:hypothetical protein [Gordonia crocea]|uniref:hypothetical protein n=1 Tax=Gordonia crocea TaxID=589162 RepID=UPI001E32D968|nr:hypothetical protein [Gordonia crocea]
MPTEPVTPTTRSPIRARAARQALAGSAVSSTRIAAAPSGGGVSSRLVRYAEAPAAKAAGRNS